MGNENTIKSLNTRLKKENKELDTLKLSSSRVNKKIINKKRDIRRIEEEIERVTNKKVVITEHALLRYLERVKGVDLESIKKEILTDARIEDAIKVLGSGNFPIQGCTLIVKDNKITTIII